MLRTLALGAILTLPLVTGGCSSMMGSDTSSASTVSRDSQGAGAGTIGGSTPNATGTAPTTPGDKNTPKT